MGVKSSWESAGSVVFFLYFVFWPVRRSDSLQVRNDQKESSRPTNRSTGCNLRMEIQASHEFHAPVRPRQIILRTRHVNKRSARTHTWEKERERKRERAEPPLLCDSAERGRSFLRGLREKPPRGGVWRRQFSRVDLAHAHYTPSHLYRCAIEDAIFALSFLRLLSLTHFRRIFANFFCLVDLTYFFVYIRNKNNVYIWIVRGDLDSRMRLCIVISYPKQ